MQCWLNKKLIFAATCVAFPRENVHEFISYWIEVFSKTTLFQNLITLKTWKCNNIKKYIRNKIMVGKFGPLSWIWDPLIYIPWRWGGTSHFWIYEKDVFSNTLQLDMVMIWKLGVRETFMFIFNRKSTIIVLKPMPFLEQNYKNGGALFSNSCELAENVPQNRSF